MSLTRLENTLDRLRGIGTTALRERQEQIEQIKSNPRLSDLAKTEQIAELDAATRKRTAGLHEQEKKEIKDTLIDLRRRVFGTVGRDAISYRDAVERAQKLESDREALEALDAAILSMDTELQSAIVQQAVAGGLRLTLARYSEENATKAEALKDLADLTAYSSNTAAQFDGYMSYAFVDDRQAGNAY